MAALPGVVDVVSGYAGGNYEDPSYRKLFTSEGRANVRNHAEVVRVTFDPKETSVRQILAGFWENHDPTQGDRQGNDVGSNYRSAIFFTSSEQRNAALTSRDVYQGVLTAASYGKITTEIAPLEVFYPAEHNHQDYLAKNPNGYCGLGGIGIKFPNGAQSSVAREPRHASDTTPRTDRRSTSIRAVRSHSIAQHPAERRPLKGTGRCWRLPAVARQY